MLSYSDIFFNGHITSPGEEVNENCRGPEDGLVESEIAEGRSRMFELKC